MHIKPIVVAIVAIAIWPVLAGISGYTLGSPPLLTGDCYQTMRADFMIPMWKQVPPGACVGAPAAPASSFAPSECVDCGNPVSHP